MLVPMLMLMLPLLLPLLQPMQRSDRAVQRNRASHLIMKLTAMQLRLPLHLQLQLRLSLSLLFSTQNHRQTWLYR